LEKRMLLLGLPLPLLVLAWWMTMEPPCHTQALRPPRPLTIVFRQLISAATLGGRTGCVMKLMLLILTFAGLASTAGVGTPVSIGTLALT
jgi:hypothetical protein